MNGKSSTFNNVFKQMRKNNLRVLSLTWLPTILRGRNR
jgi:hypothetical protein